MQPIELEKYKPSPDDPRKLECAGQRTAVEVFKELKQRLENLGLLPDEYFLFGREWEHGEEIPEGGDFFVTTDYGGSEGIYLDIYLKWYEDNKPVTKKFATGKTFGETGADLDRMFARPGPRRRSDDRGGWPLRRRRTKDDAEPSH